MHRRSVLVALGGALAGCSAGGGGPPDEGRGEPTLTPVDVPADDGSGDPLSPGESRFGAGAPSIEGVRLFHRLPEDYDVGAIPSRELFSPRADSGTVRLENRLSSPLYVSAAWELLKYTGHRWVRVLAPHLDRGGTSRVDPETGWVRRHRIRNLFTLPVLGPGLYARVERARIGAGDMDGELRPVGALFEVEGTTLELVPSRPAVVGENNATVEVLRSVDSTVVFDRLDDADPGAAEPVVTEVVGAIPLFRDGIAYLSAAGTVRVPSPSAPLTFEYLQAAPVRNVPVGPETRLEHDGTVFTVRVAGGDR